MSQSLREQVLKMVSDDEDLKPEEVSTFLIPFERLNTVILRYLTTFACI